MAKLSAGCEVESFFAKKILKAATAHEETCTTIAQRRRKTMKNFKASRWNIRAMCAAIKQCVENGAWHGVRRHRKERKQAEEEGNGRGYETEEKPLCAAVWLVKLKSPERRRRGRGCKRNLYRRTAAGMAGRREILRQKNLICKSASK